jgi:hypothetical protein
MCTVFQDMVLIRMLRSEKEKAEATGENYMIDLLLCRAYYSLLIISAIKSRRMARNWYRAWTR